MLLILHYVCYTCLLQFHSVGMGALGVLTLSFCKLLINNDYLRVFTGGAAVVHSTL